MGIEIDRFSVIYCGRLAAGVSPSSAATDLARLFDIPLVKAARIIGHDRDLILKQSAEHRRAYALKRVLERIGLIVRLERVVNRSCETGPLAAGGAETSKDGHGIAHMISGRYRMLDTTGH